MADRDGHESDASSHSSIDDDPGLSEEWDGGTRNNSFAAVSGESSSSVHPAKNSIPLQKRRRVTRACDCCRRKKIKCDGKQPCTHCTVYSYECTYDQPSNRRRNPTPQYIEALENRVQRLDALLKVVLPEVDIDHPNFDIEKLPQIRQAVKKVTGRDGASKSVPTVAPVINDQEALLETMVEATGRLDIDESGRLDFHGHSSGFAYLNKLREQFGDLLGPEVGSTTLLRLKPFRVTAGQPRSDVGSPNSSYSAEMVVLPSKELAKELVNSCLGDACLLFRFIHRPTFDRMFDRIYKLDMDDFGNEEHSYLPLVYLALAVGCLFTKKAEHYSLKNVLEEGAKYFGAGRRLVDITDCRDLTSLQCVLLMIFFLQSSAKLPTCYSYVGIAVSASFRLGMHRKIPVPDPVESEVRKRIFCTIQKMDISISALLGLPRMIHDSDIDQEYPLEVDDKYITKDGIKQGMEAEPNGTAAANAHTRLQQILGKIIQKIYPIKGLKPSTYGKSAGYMISYTTVHEIESDLAKWHDALPAYLRLGDDSPTRFLRTQYQLQLSYCHVRMMLYRPFIHYVAKPRDGRVRDERPFASAAACINASREIVHLCQQMREKDILGGAYWFMIYSTFFSILSLVYFVLENITHQDAPAILRDATIGKDCLLSLKDSSMAGERCSMALKPLFDQLPDKLRGGFGTTQATKKRGRAPSPNLPSGLVMTVNGTENNGTSSGREPLMAKKPNAFPPIARTNSENLSPRSSISLHDGSLRAVTSDNEEDENPNFAANYVPDQIVSKESLQQHLGGFTGIPDLNALMFPASNAFAYGSQAMMFDNPSTVDFSMENAFSDGMTSVGSGRRSFGTASPAYDNVEIQPYGPIPAYMYSGNNQENTQGSGQGTPEIDFINQQRTLDGGNGFRPMTYNPFIQQIPSSSGPMKFDTYPVNIDDIFNSNMSNADWEQLIAEQQRFPS